MGISIDMYRQTIGCFQPSDKRIKQKGGRLSKCKMFVSEYFCHIPSEKARKTSKSDLLKCLVLYTIIFCLSLNVQNVENCLKLTSNSSLSTQIASNHIKTYDVSETFIHIGMNWSYCLSVNKLSHMLYGNRRNIGYKYFSWNCDRALITKKKIDDVRIFAAKHKPHFISLSEVDLRRNEHNLNYNSTNELSTEQVFETLKIEGYRIILPPSWLRHNKARIIVFADEEINVNVKANQNEESHLQSILLEVGFGRTKKHLVNFYYREWKSCVTGSRAPGDQQQDLALMMDVWRRAVTSDQDFLALGDMNLCAMKWDEPGYSHKPLAELVKDFMIEENCYQLVNKYTRVQNVNGEIQRSCIDHVTVNCVEKISKLEVLGVGMSDHMGIMVTKNSREIRSHPKTTRKRVYKEFDRDAFRNDMKEAKDNGAFNEMFETDDIEVAGDIFTREYLKILEKHAPLKVIQNRNGYVPYISKELKTEMEERNKLKEEAALTGNLEVFEEYKKKRNEVSTKLKVAEAEYYKEKFEDEDMSAADMWKTAYKILGNQISSFPAQMIFSGKLYSKPVEIANEMNKFFIGKVKKLKKHSKIDAGKALIGLKKFLSKKNIPESGFQLKELDDEEMLKLIKDLKGKKSSGMDWICGYSLKIVAKDMLQELKRLVNLSIKSGKYYSKWKYSKVLPGYKNKGSKFEAQFYRPISNLAEVSKLPERAVYNQIYEYLLANGLFHPDHHGCHKNHSTATAVQQLLDLWLSSMEEGKLSAAVMLDLRAGFDVVNHSLLLLKLKEYGFQNQTIAWFQDYLSDRYQSVQIESSLSSKLHVPWGVPQGSILGPLLFLIFLNELPDIIKKRADQEVTIDDETEGSIVIFVDDNTPTVSDSDPNKLIEKMQEKTNEVTDWITMNDLTCSGEKTKLLVIGTRAGRKAKLEERVLQLTVCEDVVKESTSEKLLGIVINNTATWHHHLHGDDENDGLLPTLAKRVGVLRKLRKHTPDRKFRQLISGLFTSKLMYGATVWGGVWNIPGVMGENIKKTSITKQDMRRLQTLQNKVMRLESRMEYNTPTATLLKKTNSLSVHQMVAMYTMTQMYSVVRSQQPKYHYNRLVTTQPIGPETRSEIYKSVEFDLSISRGSFFYQSSRLWAALPPGIRNASKKNVFKKMCRRWIIQNIPIKP